MNMRPDNYVKNVNYVKNDKNVKMLKMIKNVTVASSPVTCRRNQLLLSIAWELRNVTIMISSFKNKLLKINSAHQ